MGLRRVNKGGQRRQGGQWRSVSSNSDTGSIRGQWMGGCSGGQGGHRGQVDQRRVGTIGALSIAGRRQIRGVGSRGQSEGQEAAVGAPAAVGAVGQEAELSKSLCQLPVKRPPHHSPVPRARRPHAPGGRCPRGWAPWGCRARASAPAPCGGRAAAAGGAARSAAP